MFFSLFKFSNTRSKLAPVLYLFSTSPEEKNQCQKPSQHLYLTKFNIYLYIFFSIKSVFGPMTFRDYLNNVTNVEKLF